MNRIGFILLSTAAVLSATMCSSEKEEKTDPQPVGISYIHATFSNGTKTSVSPDGLTPKWEVGDRVRLYNGEDEDVGVVERVENDGDGLIATSLDVTGKTIYAIYPESAARGFKNGKLEFRVPENQDGSFANASICCGKGDDQRITFKNATSVFKIDGKDSDIESFIIPVNGIGGDFSFDTSSESVTPKSGGASYSEISVTPPSGNFGPYYIAVAAGVEIQEGDLVAYFKDFDGCYVGTKYAANDKTLEKNNLYSLGTADANNYFEYDSYGDACMFAHGNLYCVGETMKQDSEQPIMSGHWPYDGYGPYGNTDTVLDQYTVTWGLYEKQYEFQKFKLRGYSDFAMSHYKSLIETELGVKDTLSLFTWGYSDSTTYHPTNGHGTICLSLIYHPEQGFLPDFGDFDYENDWASNLTPNGTWRTPSYDEMDYILANHKTNYSTVEVEEGKTVKGRIIMPYNWPGSGVEENISLEQWNRLEREGAVLLPDAYLRFGSCIFFEPAGGSNSPYEDLYGIYWTSSYSLHEVSNPNPGGECPVGGNVFNPKHGPWIGAFWYKTSKTECYNIPYYLSGFDCKPVQNHGASVRPVKNVKGNHNKPGFVFGSISSGYVFV